MPVKRSRSTLDLSKYKPLVHFTIPNDLPIGEYRNYLPNFLAEFVKWCDPGQNTEQARVMEYYSGGWNGDEGGIGQFFIHSTYIAHCKMYVYDGSPESASLWSDERPCQGVMFRDHADELSRAQNTIKVFLIADAFEEFLRERTMTFTRHDMLA